MEEHGARRHRMEMGMSSYTVIRYLCQGLWFNGGIGGQNINIHLAVMFRITVKIIFTIARHEWNKLSRSII
jgi:hypothetical protein